MCLGSALTGFVVLIVATLVLVVAGWEMQDLSAKLEKLRSEAEDCEFIAGLATDIRKRTLFARLALDLRSMARDVEAMIAARVTEAK
jgi:hypothetical protein